MIRVLQFKVIETGYACFENENKIFEVNKDNLQFDVKSFYRALYSEDMDYSDI